MPRSTALARALTPALAAALGGLSARPAAAQSSPPNTPPNTPAGPGADTAAAPPPLPEWRAPNASPCFVPRPLARCRSFWVVEVGVYSRLAGSTAGRPWSARQQLGNYLGWELGYMANRGPHHAVGGTAFVGLGGGGPRWGAKARYRRWLPGDFAVDVGAGPLSADVVLPVTTFSRPDGSHPPFAARGVGATGDVGLSWRGVVGVGLRADAVRARGTTARAVHSGAHLGSGAAVAGTAGLAIAAVLLFAALAGANY